MEEKFKGIVLSLSDYKDADKLASIFSLEKGIVNAKFVGIKKDKAKLKSVAQPFCFAEFNVNTKSGMRTVTNANVVDSFYNLFLDYNKTMCGYVVLDVLKNILLEEEVEEDVFYLALSALKNIEEKNAQICLIDFILKFLSSQGVPLEFPESAHVLFDKEFGNFTLTSGAYTVQVDKKVYVLLKAVATKQKDIAVSPTTLSQSLHLLHNVLYIKFDKDLKSFQFV
ncbi:MAG: DNA repair protein RecO [Clostridia bacterium]|nr:DNA repair protein RecO [Clostridia bacterium]